MNFELSYYTEKYFVYYSLLFYKYKFVEYIKYYKKKNKI